MDKKKRISFDVDVEDHIFLKIELARKQLTMRDFMSEIIHKIVQSIKEEGLDIGIYRSNWRKFFSKELKENTEEEIYQLGIKLRDEDIATYKDKPNLVLKKNTNEFDPSKYLTDEFIESAISECSINKDYEGIEELRIISDKDYTEKS